MRTVRDECKRRSQGQPCIKLYGPDMVTVTETRDCGEWCPILRAKCDLLIAERKIAA